MRDSGEPTGPMLNGSTYMVRPVKENVTWMKGSNPSVPLVPLPLCPCPGYPACSLETSHPQLAGTQLGTSSCLAVHGPHQLGGALCLVEKELQSPSCSLLVPHPWGLCGPASWGKWDYQADEGQQVPLIPRLTLSSPTLTLVLLLFFPIYSHLSGFLQVLSHLRGHM